MRKALEQLKAIVDEQSKLPTKETLDEPVYEGRTRDGKPNGKGILTWADGSRHEGIWQNGIRHGEFIYTDGKGNKYNRKRLHYPLCHLYCLASDSIKIQQKAVRYASLVS